MNIFLFITCKTPTESIYKAIYRNQKLIFSTNKHSDLQIQIRGHTSGKG